MLTQQQRDTFRLALASWNNYSATCTQDLDIDNVITDKQIVETHETIEDFFSANGRRLDRRGDRPAVPFELNTTLVGDLYVWDRVQAKRGAQRGTLYVMDFGTARAAYFSGEA